MKKLISLTLLLLAISTFAQAQNLRLNMYGLYTFQDQASYYYSAYDFYESEIQEGLTWGGGLEFETSPFTAVELLYLREDITAPTNYSIGTIYPQYREFDLDMNYMMLGGIRKLQKPGSPVEGFGGFMAGCFWGHAKDPETGNSEGTTRFAWGLKLGVNIWASEKVALKLMGQMLSPVQAMGGGLYFGTGGASAGVTTYSTIYQWSLGGGLSFKMGK